MSALRHKTSKRSFQIRLLGIVTVQAALVVTYYRLLKPLLLP
jgi:uncharacterized membrane protein YsdA (DUF1294 family)